MSERVKVNEDDIEELKNRPIATGGGGPDIDLSQLCTRDHYMNLLKRVEGTEKRNIEQDDRLTDNSHRLDKLEKMISDPLERIMALEMRFDGLAIEMNNKVNN